MSDINLDFTVATSNIQVTVDTNEITFTPTDVQLAVFAAGLGLPGGSSGELQYNNGGVIDGVANTSYSGGNLSLGDIANIKIAGGSSNYAILTDGNGNLSFASIANANYANLAGAANVAYAVNSSDSNVIITGGVNGYFLQTDGTGNLTWAAGTGGGGNGSPGGANTQIQYNDAGAFGGNVGFTFNEVTGNVAIPGALSINGNLSGAGNISVTSNVTAGNLVGNLTANTITVNTIANLGSVSNVKISGGSNGQVLTTDGNSNLSYTTINTGTAWNNTANIAVGDIFVGQLVSSNAVISPGNTVNVSANLALANWVISNTGYPAAQGVNYSGGYIWMHGGNGSFYSNVAYYTLRGDSWSSVTMPFNAIVTPEKGSNNWVTLRQGSTNNSAYSNTLTSWTNVALPTTQSWQDVAYGNGVFIAINGDLNSNVVAVSTNDGVAWTNKAVLATRGAASITYGGNAFLYVFGTGVTANNARYTNDNGNTWSNVTLGNNNPISTAYGNNKFMVVHTTGPNANSGSYTVVHSGNGAVASTGIVPVYPADVTYANGYFVVTSAGSTQNDKIAYTNDDGGNWTVGTTATNAISGTITYSSNQNVLMISAVDTPGNATNVQISTNTLILITDNTGNALTANASPTGTYKNLGGITGNVGTLWTRTA